MKKNRLSLPRPCRAVPRYLSQRVATAGSPIRDGLKKIRIESAAHPRQNGGEKWSADHRKTGVTLAQCPKLGSAGLPAAWCVLFVQHSLEKDRRCR